MENQDRPDNIESREFCATCQNTWLSTDPVNSFEISGVPAQVERQPHHETLASLSSAAHEGCYICSRVWEDVANSSESLPTPITTFEVAQVNYTQPPPVVEVNIYVAGSQSRFIVFRSQDYPSPEILSLQTDSHQTRSLLRSWYTVCRLEHDFCRAYHPGGFMPGRLIYVGDERSTSWQVCCPAAEGIVKSRYTTISYRCDNEPLLKLMAQNAEDFQAGLPNMALPKAFQDAISLTKELGIRFMWINALCIFQDSPDDIDRESATLSDIYSNSSCHFVAASRENPHESLFRARDTKPLNIQIFQHTWNIPHGDANAWADFDSIVHEDYLSRDVELGEIDPGGPVLQELFLAQRIVYLGMNQVHWMCRRHEACEVWPQGNPELMIVNKTLRAVKQF